MPDPETIRHHKHLRFFGELLHHHALWHLNRHSVAKAFAVGLFFAWVPVPFQMILAAAGAIMLRANLPVSVALVWLTNPVTMPPLFYGAYRLGSWTMGIQTQTFGSDLSMASLAGDFMLIWQPFLLGCGMLAVVSSVAGYLGIQSLWRWMVISRWRKRHLARVAAAGEQSQRP